MRSYEERLQELQEEKAKIKEELKQTQAKERALKARISRAERKKDAHRKIVVGATVESVLGRHIEIENDSEREKVLFFLYNAEINGMTFKEIMDFIPEEGLDEEE